MEVERFKDTACTKGKINYKLIQNFNLIIGSPEGKGNLGK